ncbi:hypothetical protein GCM10027298_20500 [Epidermidibacterium keratini]
MVRAEPDRVPAAGSRARTAGSREADLAAARQAQADRTESAVQVGHSPGRPDRDGRSPAADRNRGRAGHSQVADLGADSPAAPAADSRREAPGVDNRAQEGRADPAVGSRRAAPAGRSQVADPAVGRIRVGSSWRQLRQ